MKITSSILVLLTSLMLAISSPVLAEEVSKSKKAETSETQQETVNINTADAKTLAKVLKGIGPGRAATIISYRESNGKFYSPEELMSVRGIGQHIYDMNKGRIVVD